MVERKCRDILFLLLFIGFLVGMVVIGVMAFQKGNYAELMYGSDSYGNVCGKKNNWAGTGGPDLTDKKKLYFLDPTEITNPIGLLYAKKVRSRVPITPQPTPTPRRRTGWTPVGPRGRLGSLFGTEAVESLFRPTMAPQSPRFSRARLFPILTATMVS